MERQLATDPELAQRLAALEQSNEELLRRYPPEWMRGQIELKLKRAQSQRTQHPQRTWSGYRLWAVPAVALILAVVAVPTLFDRETPEAPAERVKGGEQEPSLLVFRKLTSGAERLQDGTLAQSGDLVQLAYRSGGLQYGVILSVDGRGTITQHLPATGAEAVPLAAQDTLDVAYELDERAAMGAVLLGGGRPPVWPSSGQGQAGRWRGDISRRCSPLHLHATQTRGPLARKRDLY